MKTTKPTNKLLKPEKWKFTVPKEALKKLSKCKPLVFSSPRCLSHEWVMRPAKSAEHVAALLEDGTSLAGNCFNCGRVLILNTDIGHE